MRIIELFDVKPINRSFHDHVGRFNEEFDFFLGGAVGGLQVLWEHFL